MSKPSEDSDDFRGSLPRSTKEVSEWHSSGPRVEALEPAIPIVDAHHHLFGTASDANHYRLADFAGDLNCGHRVIGTVYVEAYESGWRKTGPEAMRPVGEVEMVAPLTATAIQTPLGPCRVGAGIVSYVDLTLGDRVPDVIDEQLKAGDQRLRGVRYRAAIVEGTVGSFIAHKPRPHVLSNSAFRRGFGHLERFGLVFDAWIYHTQLDELVDLADAFPSTTIVLDHVGAPIGVAEFRPKRQEVLAKWRRSMEALAARPNIRVKIGGMGMTVFGFGFEHGPVPPASAALAEAWKPFIETCLELFSSKRCMLESNFPVDKQSCSYVELWNAFKLATQSLSGDERRDLFCATACRTYRLPGLLASGGPPPTVRVA